MMIQYLRALKKHRKAVNEETQRLLNFHSDSNVEFILDIKFTSYSEKLPNLSPIIRS